MTTVRCRYLLSSGHERASVLLLAEVALQELLHGPLYALPGHQEDGTPADVHAVVGYALEIMDYQGSPHPPLRIPTAARRRVCYEIERLGVEEIHPVVLRLEVAGAFYVAILEDVEALVEYGARGPGHLYEGGLELLVTLGLNGVHDHMADMLGERSRAHQMVCHSLHGVEQPEVPGDRCLTGLEDHGLFVYFRSPPFVADVHPQLPIRQARIARLHSLDHVLEGSLDLSAKAEHLGHQIV